MGVGNMERRGASDEEVERCYKILVMKTKREESKWHKIHYLKEFCDCCTIMRKGSERCKQRAEKPLAQGGHSVCMNVYTYPRKFREPRRAIAIGELHSWAISLNKRL